MRVLNKPELVIEDDSKTIGHCSLCGPKAHFQVGGNPADNERKLRELFRQHVREKHARMEDVNQAAARIVREATED